MAQPAGRPLGAHPEPLTGLPEWLRLDWPEPVTLSQVEIVFDDDVDEHLINLHHWRTPFDVLPTLVRDYRVEVDTTGDGSWRIVTREQNNRWRRRVHRLDEATAVHALRIVAESTNGSPRAHIVSVRAYHSG